MRYFCIFIILLSGCHTSTTTSENINEHTDTSNLTLKLDSITSALSNHEDTSIIFNKTEFEDINSEKILVDRVHYFPTTREAYVWVGFKDGYEWRALDTLKNYADSLIYEDGEITRTRYPFEKAHKYLDLELLDGITPVCRSFQLRA